MTGRAHFNLNPGISVGGGAHDNTIKKATVKNYSVGAIFGEDVAPPPYANRIDTLLVNHTSYPGVIMDRGAYDNILGQVGGVTLMNTGSPGVYRGSVFIANRPGQKDTPPHGNKVLGLVQSGTVHTPITPPTWVLGRPETRWPARQAHGQPASCSIRARATPLM